jgi:di/tricarboxylate transporter
LTRLAEIETFLKKHDSSSLHCHGQKLKTMDSTIIKIVLSVIFALSVVGKLTGNTKSTFENAGYSPIVMYTTAIAEIIFTVGLFTMYELLSTVGLLAIIGGAVFTLFRQRAKPLKYSLALIAAVLLIAFLSLQISNSSSLTGSFNL